jgi:hypothetical protein
MAPPAASLVERREAPPPTLLGARAPSGARRTRWSGGPYVTGPGASRRSVPVQNKTLIYQQNFLEFGCRSEPYPYSIGLPY